MWRYLRETLLLILSVILLAAVLGRIKPLMALSRQLEENPEPYLALTIVMTVLGVLILVGAMAVFVLRGTRDMEKVTASISTRRGKARKEVASQVEVTASPLELRESLRTGRWLRDPETFLLVLALLGGLVMALGIMGVFVVVMPPVFKVIVAGGVLYAIGRIGWAVWQA